MQHTLAPHRLLVRVIAISLTFGGVALGTAADLATLEKKIADDPTNPKPRIQLAEELKRQKGQEAKLIETLNPVADDLTLPSLLVLATAYRSQQNYRDEVRILQKAVDLAPKQHELHFKLGRAQLNADTPVEAVASFRKAITLKRDHRDSYEALLSIFAKSGENYESRNVLKDMLKQFGKRPAIYSHLCRLDSLDGYLDAAVENCQLAIKLDPKKADNHVYFAQTLTDQKNETKAAKVLNQAAKKFPKSELVQWSVGQFYLRQNNYPIAAEFFGRALAADSASSRGQLGFAVANFEQKKYGEALKAFSIACEADEAAHEKLRESQGRLRALKENDWSQKYSQEVYDCKKRRVDKARAKDGSAGSDEAAP